MRISERVSELPERKLGQIHDVIIKKKGIINFGPGWPDFEIPNNIKNYLIKLAKTKGIGLYGSTEGYPELRELICKKLKNENKIYVNPENILITVGSTEGIILSLMCTVDPGEDVLITDPSYLAYEPCTDLLTCFAQRVPTYEKDKWQIRSEEIKKIVSTKTKAMIINTPSNPTGVVLNKKTLEGIADILIDKNIVAIVDEAYEKFIYKGKHISLGSLNGMEKHVITLQSFSKEFSLAGFRVGYMVADERVIKKAEQAKISTTLCAPKISQLLAIEALKKSRKFTKDMVREFKKRRNLMYKRILKTGLSCVEPEGAFYCFVNIKKTKMKSMNFVKFLIDKANVATVPGSDFGEQGEGYVRFSFSTTRENIEKGMDKIEEVLKK